MSAARLALAAAGLAAALGTGCRRSGAGAESVRAYCDALATSFRSRDASAVVPFASEAEARRVAALVRLKTAGGLVLESELERFAVEGEERTGPDSIRVRTRERWRYHDRAVRPGVAPGRTFVAEMVMAYDVGRVAGAWKVVKAVTISNEFIEPRGFAPIAWHHGAGAERPR